MTRAVIFDMGGTLMRFVRPGSGSWRELEVPGIRGIFAAAPPARRGVNLKRLRARGTGGFGIPLRKRLRWPVGHDRQEGHVSSRRKVARRMTHSAGSGSVGDDPIDVSVEPGIVASCGAQSPPPWPTIRAGIHSMKPS